MSGQKFSKAVVRQLAAITSTRVVVAAVKTIPVDDVPAYSTLGLSIHDGKVAVDRPAPPPRACGIHAVRNLDGWREKRTDLPKEQREISSYAPSWNGGSYHLVSRIIEAWPVLNHAACNLTVSATVLEHLKGAVIVKFRVDQPLDRAAFDFAEKLDVNLRLLREAVGEAQIYPADLSDEDYVRLQHVDWEFLPPGSVDRVLHCLGTSRNPDPKRMEVAKTRLATLDRLGHYDFIVGRGSFAAYFGAKFGDKLVALESLQYGNALYVFEEDWETLSQLSRTDLMRRRDPSVERIPHVAGWQSALRKKLRNLGSP